MSAVGTERWRNNWLVVSPPGALRADVPRATRKRHALARRLGALPAGTPVVLSASAPGAIGRLRRFTSDAGLLLEREYLAFPSAGAPAYLVEDAPAPVHVFVTNVLATPPGFALAAPVDLGLALLRASAPWRLIRRIAPGRVAVGFRT